MDKLSYSLIKVVDIYGCMVFMNQRIDKQLLKI